MEQAAHCEPGAVATPQAPAEGDAATLFIEAVNAREKGQADVAFSLLGRVLALEPRHRPGSYLMGHLLVKAGQPEAALPHLMVACDGVPHFAPARDELSEVLIALKRWPQALSFCDETLEVAPSVRAHFYRGATLTRLKRYDEAIQCYERALAIDPGHVESHYNRADALCRKWKLDSPAEENLHASLAGFQRVIQLRPGMAEAHRSLGFVLNRLDRLDESIASFERAIALEPDSTAGRHTLACTLIAKGDWERGWAEYEHRFSSLPDGDEDGEDDAPDSHLTQPRAHHLLPKFQGLPAWRGEPLAGKSILLLSEGGYGDVIQFHRFVPAVRRLAANTQVVLPPPLQGLLAPGAAAPDLDAHYDFHCSLLSLPMALGARLQDLPAAPGWLRAERARVDAWRHRLGAPSRPGRQRVGVVWSGSPTHPNDMNRSMRLADLRPLFEADADFTCLQQFVRDTDRETLQSLPALGFHGEQLADFADTAALCELMDVVVCVDTSVAHLAGALGKPTWIMLPRAAEWRWMVGREDSPWYDSVRLFRQQRQGEWAPVVDRVIEALRQRHPGP